MTFWKLIFPPAKRQIRRSIPLSCLSVKYEAQDLTRKGEEMCSLYKCNKNLSFPKLTNKHITSQHLEEWHSVVLKVQKWFLPRWVPVALQHCSVNKTCFTPEFLYKSNHQDITYHLLSLCWKVDFVPFGQNQAGYVHLCVYLAVIVHTA